MPVNISCSQDASGVRFHVTAYNSQVEKILDVVLSHPGTRIGQASECFVYWKDDRRNDTWGLNFTSPIDAKQFRECCDFSKSSARYLYKNGLRLGSKSSPASPTKQEPQCTCTTMHLSEKQKQLRMQSSRGKKVNFFRIRSMCLELQFSRPRWRWVSAATIASDRYV